MNKTILYLLLIVPQFSVAQFISRGTGISENGRAIISMSTISEEIAWAVTFDGVNFNQPTNEWMRTTDGGETWDTGSLPFSNTAMATYTIHALDEMTAYVSAGTQPNFTEGAIYKTTDGGQNWTEQATFDNRSPGEFIFWNENEGMTFGFSRIMPNEIIIYRTEDGGDNWQTIEIPDVLPGEWCAGYSANGLLDSQGDHVWIGTIAGRVLHSSDRGLTWEAIQVTPPGRAILGVAFADEFNGVAVSPASSSGAAAPNRAYRTSDGGATWEEIEIPANPIAGALEHVPGTVGTYLFSNVIFGETDIAYTHDGGDTWAIMDGPGLWAIDFTSPTSGWLGGEIASATEGGMYRFTSDFSADHANVTTLAGNSTEGYITDKATNSNFYNPKGIDIADDGSVFVIDQFSSAVKKISPNGAVSLVYGDNSIFGQREINQGEGILYLPDGNLLIANTFNRQISLLDLNGTEPELTAFAGTGAYGLDDGPLDEATFARPRDLAMDANGNIYVGDDVAIRKITPDGMVTTLAGSFGYGFLDGNGPEARFDFIWGIDVTDDGDVYVADAFNHAIRKVSQDGEVTTVAGSGFSGYQDGSSGTAEFSYPEDVAIDNGGNILVADGTNGVIRKITPDGEVSTIVGMKTADYFPGYNGPDAVDGEGNEAIFSRMRGLAMRPNGNLLVTEWGTDLVREIQMGVPSHPLVVSEVNIENPYLIGHIRHIEPYDFTSVVTNTVDFPIEEVEMRVWVRQGAQVVFQENSATNTIPEQSFEYFDLENSFSPEDTGIYDVQFQFWQNGEKFHTQHRQITISDQSMDYGDGLPFAADSYANYFPDFQGGYGVDFIIDSADSLSGIAVGFGLLDSVATQFSVLKLDGSEVVDTIYSSGMQYPDSLTPLNTPYSFLKFPEAIFLETGHYLFTFEEEIPSTSLMFADGDITGTHNWLKDPNTGAWSPAFDLIGFHDIHFMIRPVFGNPEIISSVFEIQVPKVQISALPNPFSDQVQVSLPIEAEHPSLVEITDLNGKRIDFFRLSPGETVNKQLGHLTSGTYLVVYEIGGLIGAKRIMKK